MNHVRCVGCHKIMRSSSGRKLGLFNGRHVIIWPRLRFRADETRGSGLASVTISTYMAMDQSQCATWAAITCGTTPSCNLHFGFRARDNMY